MKILFLGLGNPILSDDAVGIRVVEEIERRLGERRGIRCATESVGGLRILDVMRGYEKAVIVDAIVRGGVPGTLYKIPLDDLKGCVHLMSAHSMNLTVALEWGGRMGEKLPREVSIYGIEVQNIVEFSEKLTREVEEAIPRIVDEIMEREIDAGLGAE